TSLTLVSLGSIPVNISSELQPELRSNYSASLSQGGFSRHQDAEVTLYPAEEFQSNIQTGSISLRPPRRASDKDLILENVPPGRYWIEVQPIFPLLYPASITCEGIDLLRNPLVVGLGGSAGPIDIVLRDDGSSLDGIVEDMPHLSPAPIVASDSIDSF